MNKNIRRRMNDGGKTGIKLDRFRHSRFEYEQDPNQRVESGVSEKTPNTIGGPWEDNRGRRTADERFNDDDNPFARGRVQNWNHRKGWDHFYDRSYDKEGNRLRGGALIGDSFDHGHRGKGPRGYVRPDKNIYEDVCEMLSLSSEVDASDIEVKVENGIVFLNGTVADRYTKRMAELEIDNVSGVKDVQNMLSFKRSEDSSRGFRH